ncbi:hypothetical protein [Micromonospora globbae]|uniref:hypothetical protein n=1 Tax=Micromonospora globbae TaxID=1894969 RepID=UPI0038647A84|nr:hypothetical protein OH732_03000 [Micromonospora globbae]
MSSIGDAAATDYPDAVQRELVDPTLGYLVWLFDLTSTRDLSISMVLAIPGGTLSGHLISRARWYKEWFESIGKAGIIGKEMSRLMQANFAAAGRAEQDGGLLDHVGKYVHIRDGVFHTGSGTMPPMLWRVRMDIVSAWSLGPPPEREHSEMDE